MIIICVICDSKPGLCYLHKKYKAKLTGPFFDTLFDYMWFRETFKKEWAEKVGTRLKVELSESVERNLQNKLYVRKVGALVKDLVQLMGDGRIWKYRNIVHKMAFTYSKISPYPYDDIVQQGYYELMSIDRRINWAKFSGKEITMYIKQSIIGKLKNYCFRDEPVEFEQINEDMDGNDIVNPEKLTIYKERSDFVIDAINKLITNKLKGTKYKRERYVLRNYLYAKLRSKKSMNEIAKKFDVSHVTIYNDKEKLLKMLGELLDG